MSVVSELRPDNFTWSLWREVDSGRLVRVLNQWLMLCRYEDTGKQFRCSVEDFFIWDRFVRVR